MARNRRKQICWLLFIEKMLVELELDLLKYQEVRKNRQNQDVTVFSLNEELSVTLVSGYNLKMRNAIIRKYISY